MPPATDPTPFLAPPDPRRLLLSPGGSTSYWVSIRLIIIIVPAILFLWGSFRRGSWMDSLAHSQGDSHQKQPWFLSPEKWKEIPPFFESAGDAENTIGGSFTRKPALIQVKAALGPPPARRATPPTRPPGEGAGMQTNSTRPAGFATFLASCYYEI